MARSGRRHWPAYLVGFAAAAATAVIGSLGTRPNSTWYRQLDKPDWQPPSSAFGPVWTTLYVMIAFSAGRTLNRLPEKDRAAYIATLATNLALNAGWNWAFFRAESPLGGLVEILALNAANAELIRRTATIDKPAAVALIPYAAWVAFATVLNAELLRLNPDA